MAGYIGSVGEYRGVASLPPSALPPLPESWLPNEHPLYRPRHGRQGQALIAALVFFLIPPLLLVSGVRAPDFENRRLAEFPSPADGWSFFTGLEAWATDHLPLRDAAVQANDAISRAVFGEPPHYAHAPSPDRGPVGVPAQPDDTSKSPQTGYQRVIEGVDGWLYLGLDVRGACYPQRSLAAVSRSLARLRAGVEASGRRFVLVVAPNKSTMVPQYLPETYAGRECAAVATRKFWSEVVPAAQAVDLRARLTEAAENQLGPVYTQYDSHWTHLGALVMTAAIADAAEPGITRSWRMLPGRWVSYPGDLPPLIGRTAQAPNRLYDLAPDGERVLSRPIGTGFRTPLRLAQPSGPGVVSEPTGMIADSFTQSALPYLAGGFGEVTLMHSSMAAKDPAGVGRMLAESDVVVVEVAERDLVSGSSPMVSRNVIDEITTQLAAYPR